MLGAEVHTLAGVRYGRDGQHYRHGTKLWVGEAAESAAFDADTPGSGPSRPRSTAVELGGAGVDTRAE